MASREGPWQAAEPLLPSEAAAGTCDATISADRCARLTQQRLHVRRVRLYDHQELRPCQGLEAVQVKRVNTQQLDAGAARYRRQLHCYCVQRVPAAGSMLRSVTMKSTYDSNAA